MTTRNFIAVIGRMHGDDEDQCRLYEGLTVAQARQQFINELRRDDNIPEADVVAEYEYTNVYITHVLSSRDEIIEE